MQRTGLEVAIIGMAGRFPGAKNITEFWNNIKEGKESITFFNEKELLEAGNLKSNVLNPNYVKAKGIMDNIDSFDAGFFDYTPREAGLLDPQIRLLHECTWEALEDAGYVPDEYKGLIGLYTGPSICNEWIGETLKANFRNLYDFFTIPQFSDKDFLSTRISYKLNLRGPSYVTFSACSSALVAIHLACQSLLSGESNMAVAGGASVSLPVKHGYMYQDGMLYSKDGHCRPFDSKATGTVFSNGMGLVVLKLLENAINDGDNIYSIIRASGTNNDGGNKVGYTAPSSSGQTTVIKSVMKAADIKAEDFSFIEAHGTGTQMGDPIEVEGLKQAFNTNKRNYCRIGSVKSNVGHLDTAAGVASLIKAALSLKYKLLPPTINFSSPNPKIDFENSPFIVNTELTKLESNGKPLIAGVSSFGIGGTNAYIILEEPPAEIKSNNTGDNQFRPVLISAKSVSSLENNIKNLTEFILVNKNIDFNDLVYTLATGRKSFNHRAMLVCSNSDEIITKLHNNEVYNSTLDKDDIPVVFMFSGQGSQYINMGKQLYENIPLFRKNMDYCLSQIKPYSDIDFKSIIYPDSEENDDSINNTEITQPLIFIIEYALAKMLIEWGVTPNAMIGHSIGEYVAACISGVISLEDCLKLVCIRGKLMQKAERGAMLSIPLSEGQVKKYIPAANGIDIAAVNTNKATVVAGSIPEIEELKNRLESDGITATVLKTSHAFHSYMMDGILDEFKKSAAGITFSKPNIPFISNVSGTWITNREATDTDYWTKHLRSAVRFADGITNISKDGKNIYIEIGPGRALSSFTKQIIPGDIDLVFNLIRHPKEEINDNCFLVEKIGQLWLKGVKFNWDKYYSDKKVKRISLPTYSFEKRNFSLKLTPFNENTISSKEAAKVEDITKWIYTPSWKKSFIHNKKPINNDKGPIDCLVFTNNTKFEQNFISQLRALSYNIWLVKTGNGFIKEDDRNFILDPENEENYIRLLDEIKVNQNIPCRIIYFWTLSAQLDKIENICYYNILSLVKALGSITLKDEARICLITDQTHEIIGDEVVIPKKSLVMGPVRVIPKEYQNISVKCIEVRNPECNDITAENLIIECFEQFKSSLNIAYRNNFRWEQIFELVENYEYQQDFKEVKEDGVYWILGGMGGIGFELTKYFALKEKAHIILSGRTNYPLRESWNSIITDNPDSDLSMKLTKILELEKNGSAIMLHTMDLSDIDDVKSSYKFIIDKFRHINGIIHCAGAADGSMIQARKKEISEMVFSSKVRGLENIEKVADNSNLDFFVISSSVNSFLAPVGQVAYVAANNYIDTFAHHKSKNSKYPVRSLNWDIWQDVGMAYEAKKSMSLNFEIQDEKLEHITHQWFTKYSRINENLEIYVAELSVKKFWILNEHKIKGNGIVLGTSYLEMAQSIMDIDTLKGVEIRNVTFLNPIIVGDHETRNVYFLIKKDSNSSTFYFITRSDNASEKWKIHVKGEIARANVVDDNINNKNLIETYTGSEKIFNSENHAYKSTFIEIGERWHTLKKLIIKENEGLGYYELGDAYLSDLEKHRLHPALLDIATSTLALVGDLKKNESGYLPYSYKKIKLYGNIPGKFYSLIKLTNADNYQEQLCFNITLSDINMEVIAEIEQFRLLTVEKNGKKQVDDYIKTILPDVNNMLLLVAETIGKKKNDKAEEYYRQILQLGILPNEGMQAFNYSMQINYPQVIISTYNFNERLKSSFIKDEKTEKAEKSTVTGQRTDKKKPGNNTRWLPENEIEQSITAIWEDFFGFKNINTTDDFFQLGGDSMSAIKIINSIQEKHGINVPISDFFNNPTINGLSAYISNINLGSTGSNVKNQEIKVNRKEQLDLGKDRLKQIKVRSK